MKKISKSNYNRLVLQAEELKLQGNKKLANIILNMIGPLTKEAQAEDASLTVVHDLKANLEASLFESIASTLDILNTNIDAEQVQKMSEFYCDKILKDIVKIRKS